MSPCSTLAFYRSSGGSYPSSSQRVIEAGSLPRIHRNPTASDSPIIGLNRRLAGSINYSSSGQRKLDETASAVATDLLYRYGGQAMTAERTILDRTRSGSGRASSYGNTVHSHHPSHHHHQQQHSSSQQQQQQHSSSSSNNNNALLCRCGSGGALPATGSPPPNLLSSGPVVSSSFVPTTSFRGVQSLPSTPNACRRPLSPSPFSQSRPSYGLGLGLGLEVVPPSGRIGFSDIGPPLSLPPPPMNDPLGGGSVPRGQDHFLFGSDGGGGGNPTGQTVSESAILAGDLSTSNEDGIGGRFRALQQFNHQQTRSLRYRSSSQPLMKLSTLVIVVLALIIIGFIVLSPLFHYFM